MLQIQLTQTVNKNKKMSSFKSNENIHKKEDGSYYVVSTNKASSVKLNNTNYKNSQSYGEYAFKVILYDVIAFK